MYLASAHTLLGDSETALRTLGEAHSEVGTVDEVFRATWERVRTGALAGSSRLPEARAAVAVGLASAVEQGLTYEQGLLMLIDVELHERIGVAPSQQTLDEIGVLLRGLGVDPSRALVDAGWDVASPPEASLLRR